MKARFLFSAILSWTITSSSCAAAENVSSEPYYKVPAELLGYSQVSDLHLSRRGDLLAFVTTDRQPDRAADQNVWIVDAKAGRMQSTAAARPDIAEMHPRWSPDGRILALLSASDLEPAGIELLHLADGSRHRLETGRNAVHGFAWSPDGRSLAILQSAIERRVDNSPIIVDEIDDRPVLRIFDLKTNVSRKILSDEWRIAEVEWMPDGRHIALTASRDSLPETVQRNLYLLDTASGGIRQLTHLTGPIAHVRVSPDGRHIAFLASRTAGPIPCDLLVVRSDAEELDKHALAAPDLAIVDLTWRNSNEMVVLAQQGFRSVFHQLSLTGGTQPLALRAPVNPSRSFVLDGERILFAGESFVDAPEIWTTQRKAVATRLTRINSALDAIKPTQPQLVSYISFDGLPIEAALFRPRATGNSRLPAIVLAHGGPSDRWAIQFRPEWTEPLVRRGYLVLLPNVRGSTGYGSGFLQKVRRDWGGADYRDLLAAAQSLVNEWNADADRVGVAGYSYGGYLSTWAVTQTDRFKAAVALAPMTELAFEFGTEAARVNAYDAWHLGRPYDDPGFFASRSPVTFIARVSTPTLLLCALQDEINPPAQCRQFHRGLRHMGVKTGLVEYPREGHDEQSWSVAHRLDVAERMVRWFDDHLR